jgi:DNA-binding NarL/FixJ family response regulator
VSATILLADDHEIFRHGLRALLEVQREWTVAGEAATGRQAVEMARELSPDVVVLDVSMPELNGIEAARQILSANPQMRILIMTMHDSERLVHELLELGVRGYVLKSDAKRDIVAAISTLLKNRPFFTSSVSQMLVQSVIERKERPNDEGLRRLTPREREILQLIAEGQTTKEVAIALSISAKTAETHRTHIMSKLNLSSVSDLVRYAVRNKIIEA